MGSKRVGLSVSLVALAGLIGCSLPMRLQPTVRPEVDAQVAAVASSIDAAAELTSGDQSAGDGGVNIGTVQLGGDAAVAVVATGAMIALGWIVAVRKARRYRRVAQLLVDHNHRRSITQDEKREIAWVSTHAGVARTLDRLVRRTRQQSDACDQPAGSPQCCSTRPSVSAQ